MEVYVVTCDGHLEGYGSEIYLVSVCTSDEEVKKATSNSLLHYTITKITVGEVSPMESSGYDDNYSNKNYLGGYIE